MSCDISHTFYHLQGYASLITDQAFANRIKRKKNKLIEI